MLQAAQSILNSGSFLNSKAWLQLLDYVDEQLLMAELMRVQRGRARLEFGSAVRETAIVAKAKSYYVNNHSCESSWSVKGSQSWNLACSYLTSPKPR